MNIFRISPEFLDLELELHGLWQAQEINKCLFYTSFASSVLVHIITYGAFYAVHRTYRIISFALCPWMKAGFEWESDVVYNAGTGGIPRLGYSFISTCSLMNYLDREWKNASDSNTRMVVAEIT